MRTQLFFSFLMVFLLASCAASNVVSPTSTAVQVTVTWTPSPTTPATVTVGPGGVEAIDGVPVTKTATPEETATPTATSTPETLLPPDFTVKDRRDLDKQIVPYCYVRPDFKGGAESNLVLLEEIKASGFYQFLMDRLNGGEISNFAPGMVDAPGGGACGVIVLRKKVNGRGVDAGAYFQSRLTQEWVEVEYTEPR